MGNPLSVVRQNLSSVVGDLIMGTAGSGGTTNLVHTMLRKANDYYQNHNYRCYIYAGTNTGEERETSDWVLSNNTLTVDPAFTAAIDATSKYELHYIFTESEYRKAINLAINALTGGKYLIDKVDASIILVADQYEYNVPSGMSYITRITTEDTADTGDFEEFDVIDSRSWRMIPSRRFKLDESYYSITAGKDLRIEGQGEQAQLNDDNDMLELPLEWVIQKAVTFLPKNKVQSNSLDSTYQQALLMSGREPRRSPDPWARRVLE